MNEIEFVDSLRHYLPEAETFLLETLSQESLSCEASSTLIRIQERFNSLIGSQCSDSDLIFSPPAGFRDDVVLTPQVSPHSSSQITDFSLQIDSDTSSVMNTIQTTTPTTTTTTTTNTQIPRKLKQFKRIKIRRKRQRHSLPSSQKRMKVLSGRDDVTIDGDISFSPINCEDNESSDILEPPRQFSHDSTLSSSSISDTTTSSSSCSSPLARESADNNDEDLLNIYIRSEEAFPSSENNTPELELVCETQIVEKISVKSRLGVRADIIDTEIELAPSPKFRPKFDIVKNLYPNRRPLKCNDCHKDIPLVTQDQFKCKHCLYKYCTRAEFDSHVTEGKSICLNCRLTHNTECQLNIHMSKHPKIHLCKDCVCVRQERSDDKLDRLGPSHSADGTYYCPKCYMKFKTKFDLNTHHETVHSNLTNSPLLLESHQPPPERATPPPVPKLVRAVTHELEPNCELQISKDDATREFGLLRQRQTF